MSDRDMSSNQRNALQLAKEALTHVRPEQCWAMGPSTGDIIEDYVICPGCRALHAIEIALQAESRHLATHRPTGER